MNTPATIDPTIPALIARLSSDADGERIACVKAIGRKLEKTGATFNDLAARLEGRAAPDQGAVNDAFQRGWSAAMRAQAETTAEPRTLAERAAWLAENAEHLRPHERKFVRQMAAQAWRGGDMGASPKQADWLEGLFARHYA